MPKKFFRPNKQNNAQANAWLGRTVVGEVRDVINNGAGIIVLDEGLTVFVWGVWLGENVRVKILAVKKGIAQAQLLEVLTASPARRTIQCRFAGAAQASAQCGGCLWQHVQYDAQIEQKQRWAEKAFSGLTEQVLPCRPSATEWRYRNRAELKSDGKALGYVARQSHQLVDVDDCPVLNDTCQSHLAHLRNQLPNNTWQKRRSKHDLPLTLLAIDDELSSSDIRADIRRPFKQANTEQNAFMRDWLDQQLDPLPKTYRVAELFCGAGNFTEVIAAKQFAAVYATEGDSNPLEALAKKDLPNVQTEVVNAFDEQAFGSYVRKIAPFEVLVLDPPRDGLKVIEPIFKVSSIKHVFYISCDLATCRRDVERFVDAGFRVNQVQPLDQFPQTPHLELCVAMSRK